MNKVIGMIRNRCGKIVSLVMVDPATGERSVMSATNRAEELYGRFPQYTDDLQVIGNQGLVFLEKDGHSLKLVTCAGAYVNNGDEQQVIEKTRQLEMRMVNAEIHTTQNSEEYLYIL